MPADDLPPLFTFPALGVLYGVYSAVKGVFSNADTRKARGKGTAA